MDYPRIYLAIDNCFASKRWTSPREWMSLIKSLGVSHVECSADNECDPLYSTPEFIDEWIAEIKRESESTGVRVANLYSGHGTYSTLGLAHTDDRVRDHILEDWIKPMVTNAGRLGAGLGFFAHAFCDAILQDEQRYRAALDDLYERLAQIAAFADDQGCRAVGLEQMYTPHQVPWTIRGTKDLMKHVYALANHPLHITIDTGHQSGQRKFLRPTREQILNWIEQGRQGQTPGAMWLGPSAAYARFETALKDKGDSSGVSDIVDIMQDYPWMFAEPVDGSTYDWLEALACHSPIIHLQQTDGEHSLHWPFTPEFNEKGIVEPARVLKAIAKAYEREAEPGMPPRCESIYLTLEMFSATADINYDIINRYRHIVEYWRSAVPEDGRRLEECA